MKDSFVDRYRMIKAIVRTWSAVTFLCIISIVINLAVDIEYFINPSGIIVVAGWCGIAITYISYRMDLKQAVLSLYLKVFEDLPVGWGLCHAIEQEGKDAKVIREAKHLLHKHKPKRGSKYYNKHMEVSVWWWPRDERVQRLGFLLDLIVEL